MAMRAERPRRSYRLREGLRKDPQPRRRGAEMEFTAWSRIGTSCPGARCDDGGDAGADETSDGEWAIVALVQNEAVLEASPYPVRHARSLRQLYAAPARVDGGRGGNPSLEGVVGENDPDRTSQ